VPELAVDLLKLFHNRTPSPEKTAETGGNADVVANEP
jgi:hypothetical protein